MFKVNDQSTGKLPTLLILNAALTFFNYSVFFGETLIGEMRPNLTYMLTFDDMEEHDKNWKVFGSDPEWKKIAVFPNMPIPELYLI